MITLYRSYKKDKTDGVMVLPNDDIIKTLERPNLNNQPNVSCIPEGQYIISRDHTGKCQWFKVNNVLNRTDIEIHLATRVSQLLGCIGVCKKEDLEYLIELFGENDWILEIVEDEKAYKSYLSEAQL